MTETTRKFNEVDLKTKNISKTVSQKPAFIEQFVTGFYGRGQLSSEKPTEYRVTEQFIVSNAGAGSSSVVVTDATKFVVGGGCVIKHNDGTYMSHFIKAISGNTLTISPTLQKKCYNNIKKSSVLGLIRHILVNST